MIEVLQVMKREITRPRHPRGRRNPTFYPSSASAKHGGYVEGACWRADWYRIHNVLESDDADFYMHMIWSFGNHIEAVQIKAMMKSGMYENDGVRFFDEARNISGKLDIVGRYRGSDGEIQYFGVECMSPGSLVMQGDYGFTRADAVSSEHVIGHTGNINRVINHQVKEVTDVTLYRIRSKADGLMAKVTAEHPYRTCAVTRQRNEDGRGHTYAVTSRQWTKASDLKPGDYISIPKARFTGGEKIVFSDAVTAWPHRKHNGLIYSMSKDAFAQERGFPRLIEFDKEFAWLVGLYIAGGSCSEDTVYLSFNADRVDLRERLTSVVSRYGLEAVVAESPGYAVSVGVESRAFRELIKRIVPGDSTKRAKPIDYGLVPSSLLSSLLDGILDGNGYVDTGSHLRKINAVTPALSFLYFQLAAHLGWSPSLEQFKQGATKFGDSYIYVVSWSESTHDDSVELVADGDEAWCYPIEKIDEETYSGKVYNMETGPDHSYVVGAVATHNCKSVHGYGTMKSITGRRRAWGGQKPFDPKPKESNVFQVMVYLDQFGSHHQPEYRLDFFKLTYIPRDKPIDGREYTVVLTTGDELAEKLERYAPPGMLGGFDPERVAAQMEAGKRYALIMSSGLMPYVELRYPLEAIYERFAQLQQYIANKQPPPRPEGFSKYHAPATIELMHKEGIILKTAYEKWTKKGRPKQMPGVTPGHFLCQSYCDWRSFCFNEDGTPNPEADLVGVEK